MRVPAFSAFSLSWSLVLFWGCGCTGPKDNALFADDGLASTAVSSTGGSGAAVSGTDSGSGAGQSIGGFRSGGAGSVAGTGGNATSGNATSGNGSGGDAVTSGGNGGSGPVKVIESCDMLEGAITNEQNGHCYRVTSDKLTFAAARDACKAAAGHLVTLSVKAEDDFTHDLLDAAHWIGACDGRSDRAEGTGPYTWVDGAPWVYTNWESGQPNAVGTNCPDEDSGSNCYEHCAFQTAGGAWNDRACFHAIASICEWDVEPTPGAEGGGGPAR